MVIVELSIIPIGKTSNISKVLAPALKELDYLGVEYEITPMCTIFEAANVDGALNLVKAAHEAVFQGDLKRVVTTVKIDDRRDIEKSMKEKVQSLKRAIKEPQN